MSLNDHDVVNPGEQETERPNGDGQRHEEDGETSERDGEDIGWMKSYFWRMGLLAMVLNFVPSEPFLAKFLLEDKGVTMDEMNTKVWPVETYSSLIFLLPVGLAAEVWGYRKMIFAGLVARQLTRGILVLGSGVTAMALMQVTYAFQAACDTVFFAYVLIIVPEHRRGNATALTIGLFHAGNVLSSLLGQLLVDIFATPLISLLWLSWIGQIVAFTLAIFVLPYPLATSGIDTVAATMKQNGATKTLLLVPQLFQRANPGARAWMVWTVFATASAQVFGNYYQAWLLVLNKDTKFGMVEVGIEFSHVLGAFCAGVFVTALMTKRRLLLHTSTAFMVFLVLSDTTTALSSTATLAAVSVAVRSMVFSGGQTVAQVSIAAGLHRPLFALTLASCTLLGLAFASITSILGSIMTWSVQGWFLAAMCLSGGGVCFCTFIAHKAVVNARQPAQAFEEEEPQRTTSNQVVTV